MSWVRYLSLPRACISAPCIGRHWNSMRKVRTISEAVGGTMVVEVGRKRGARVCITVGLEHLSLFRDSLKHGLEDVP